MYDRVTPPIPVVVEDDDGEHTEWEVERILRKNKRGDYLVKWKGFGPEHNSWVKRDDIANAPDLVAEYEGNPSLIFINTTPVPFRDTHDLWSSNLHSPRPPPRSFHCR